MDHGEQEKLLKKKKQEARIARVEERLERLEKILAAHESEGCSSRENEASLLLKRWLDVHDTGCRYDHHGYCQEHFLEDKGDCIVFLTGKFLAARENEDL
jgi:hypothetical protein